MTELIIVPDLEGYWKGSPPKVLEATAPVVIGGLEGGMATGNPSVGIIVEIEPGLAVFAQTSLKLFLAAADVLKAKYGDPRIEPTGPAA